MTVEEFVSRCPECGGLTERLLNGIKQVFPDAYEQLPDTDYSYGVASFIVGKLTGSDNLNVYVDIERGAIWKFVNGRFERRLMSDEEMDMPIRKLYATIS